MKLTWYIKDMDTGLMVGRTHDRWSAAVYERNMIQKSHPKGRYAVRIWK